MDDPTPQAQLDFLQNVQRLLDEGTFTATYKFALLLVLADLCVEQGADTGATLRIDTSQVAKKFIQYTGHKPSLTSARRNQRTQLGQASSYARMPERQPSW